MATPMAESFSVWLTEKLTAVSSDIDTDVFVSFIVGILETGDDNEEKLESIGGLLEGVMEPDKASEVSNSILDEWIAVSEKSKENEATNDIGDKLSKIMEGHTIATIKERQLTDEEKSRKAAILKQYAEVSDEEDTDDEFGDDSGDQAEKQDDALLMKNVNKHAVEKNMRDAREKSKQEHENKKEKNKQDRQAQKQKAEERKQSEKKRTQKGERRR